MGAAVVLLVLAASGCGISRPLLPSEALAITDVKTDSRDAFEPKPPKISYRLRDGVSSDDAMLALACELAVPTDEYRGEHNLWDIWPEQLPFYEEGKQLRLRDVLALVLADIAELTFELNFDWPVGLREQYIKALINRVKYHYPEIAQQMTLSGAANCVKLARREYDWRHEGVGYELVPDVSAGEAISILRAELARNVDDFVDYWPHTPADFVNSKQPRKRDLWAFIFADLTGAEFDFDAAMTIDQREQAIRELLDQPAKR
ncbi:MAG: hypothetical protein H6839_16520 [Planctomycetes bacterium]|nr:hypothetical protein [Planctomycetota bacterium]